jgi:hypothetical protein
MLAYPFPLDSFADECLLPNDAERVIGLNRDAPTVRGIAHPFFIGDDGGEELYFVDLNTPDSPVYVFDLETGRHSVKATNWPTYLAQVHSDLADIEKDQVAERDKRSRKRWWQFWR